MGTDFIMDVLRMFPMLEELTFNSLSSGTIYEEDWDSLRRYVFLALAKSHTLRRGLLGIFLKNVLLRWGSGFMSLKLQLNLNWTMQSLMLKMFSATPYSITLRLLIMKLNISIPLRVARISLL